MAKRFPLTLEQKAEILVQNGKELTPVQISRNLNIPRTTIISFLKKYQRTQALTNHAGRPKKVNDQIREEIIHRTQAKPFEHLRDHEAHLPLGRESIRKVLHEEKIDYYQLTPVSPLKEEHIGARLTYCDQVLENGLQPVVFTDESTVVLDLSRHGIWRQRGFHPPESFYWKDHHPVHVMVWGAIGPGGFRTDLVRCPPSLTAYNYCKLLADNHVFYQCSRLGNYIWQQDGAPRTGLLLTSLRIMYLT